MFTFWKLILILTLGNGAVAQDLEFETAAQCQAAQEYLANHGLTTTNCAAITVWSNVGPDGYDPLEGEFVE